MARPRVRPRRLMARECTRTWLNFMSWRWPQGIMCTMHDAGDEKKFYMCAQLLCWEKSLRSALQDTVSQVSWNRDFFQCGPNELRASQKQKEWNQMRLRQKQSNNASTYYRLYYSLFQNYWPVVDGRRAPATALKTSVSCYVRCSKQSIILTRTKRDHWLLLPCWDLTFRLLRFLFIYLFIYLFILHAETCLH